MAVISMLTAGLCTGGVIYYAYIGSWSDVMWTVVATAVWIYNAVGWANLAMDPPGRR